MENLKENLPTDLVLTEYASGKVVILQEKSSKVKNLEWPNNPDILAETHSGLWSTCLSLSGWQYINTFKKLLKLLDFQITSSLN